MGEVVSYSSKHELTHSWMCEDFVDLQLIGSFRELFL